MRSFQDLYARDPEVVAAAPGRVNLIGEHTDYNGGFVLPAATPQTTRVEIALRRDRIVRAWSEQFASEPPLEYRIGAETPGRGWLDYVAGVTRALTECGSGQRIGGFDLRISSRVPPGAGLASSAALEVALLRALREAFALSLDDLALALVGQRAENDFVGAPVGIMDQMAASLASPGSALFLDTRALAYERIPLPSIAELVVVDSAVPHAHATGEYRARRRECEEAAAELDVRELRDVPIADLARVESLPEPFGRRARHVITENARVLEAVRALRSGDLARFGTLLDASHESLRSDFEVSTPDVDRLVDSLRAQPGVYGARMTGGGFGGSVLGLATRGTGRSAGDASAASYRERTRRPARVLLPEAA